MIYVAQDIFWKFQKLFSFVFSGLVFVVVVEYSFDSVLCADYTESNRIFFCF